MHGHQLYDPGRRVPRRRVVARVHADRGLCPGHGAQEAQVGVPVRGGVPGDRRSPRAGTGVGGVWWGGGRAEGAHGRVVPAGGRRPPGHPPPPRGWMGGGGVGGGGGGRAEGDEGRVVPAGGRRHQGNPTRLAHHPPPPAHPLPPTPHPPPPPPGAQLLPAAVPLVQGPLPDRLLQAQPPAAEGAVLGHAHPVLLWRVVLLCGGGDDAPLHAHPHPHHLGGHLPHRRLQVGRHRPDHLHAGPDVRAQLYAQAHPLRAHLVCDDRQQHPVVDLCQGVLQLPAVPHPGAQEDHV